MRDGYNFALQQSKRKKSLFTVVFAGILGGDRVPGEDRLGVYEIDTMLFQVLFALGFIPREHTDIVAT